MKTRIFYTKFWLDSYILTLSPTEKLFFNYLITNENIGHTGYFELPNSLLILATGLSKEKIETIKKKLEKDKKAVFYKDWVYLVNHKKYQAYTGEKNEKAREKEQFLIPTEVTRYCMHRVSGTPDSLINHKSKTINQKKEKKYSKLEDLEEKDFNEIAKKYDVPMAFVLSKYDDMVLWVGEKQGRGKGRNWRLTLMNWVKRDAIKIKKENYDGKKTSAIDASNL